MNRQADLNEWVEVHKARIAELVVVNGGTMEVKRVGKPVPANNRYGREVLNPHEALQLAYMHGCFDSLPGDRAAAKAAIEDEIAGRLICEATPEQRRALLGR